MSLERIQAINNAATSKISNVSASLNPTQHKHDANEVLIKGAELAAAGRSLGLNEEETLAAVSRQYRRQKRADQNVSKQDILRQMAQSEATTRESVGTGEIQGVGYKGVDDVAYAFGEDVAYNSETSSTRADDEQTYRANDRGFTEDPETGLVRRETFDETRGEEVRMAPKTVLTDALGDLQRSAERQRGGMGGSIARVFGGSGVDSETSTAMDALQEYLGDERKMDARVGRALVRQDNANYSPRVRAENDEYVANIADTIARTGFTVNGPGAMADEAIGRIAEIKNLGKVGETAQVIRTADDAIQGQIARRQDGVYIDPRTGNPVAIQGPELPAALAGDRRPNNSSSSNSLNAPQTAREWVTQSMPDYKEGGKTFGEFPQVDITLETTQAANKIRELGQRIGMPGLAAIKEGNNIRSIDELQNVATAVDAYYRQGQQPKTMFVKSPETGKSVPAGNQVVSGLMEEMRMTSGEEERLANALYQLDAANRSSVNQNPTGTYLGRSVRGPGGQQGVVFDSAEAIDKLRTGSFTGTKVGQQQKGTRMRVGTNEKGKGIFQDIKAAMRGLENPDAARPYVGQPAKMPAKESLSSLKQDQVYNRTGQTEPSAIADAITRQAQSRLKKGESLDTNRVQDTIIGAQAVQRRADEDLTRRSDLMSTIIGSLPATARRSVFPRGAR